MWPVERPQPRAGVGVAEQQWQSMTYGVMPSKASYERHYNAIVGANELYTMDLVGADENIVVEAWGEPQFTGGYGKAGYNFDRDELWSLLEELTNMYNDGNEAAGDLASGILTTLHFEWI